MTMHDKYRNGVRGICLKNFALTEISQWFLHNKAEDAKISPITIEEASGAAAALKRADSR